MRARVFASAAAVAALVFPLGAQADITIEGHGSGHGIGMPQYGAYGYALKTRHTDAYILAHFYPGTRLGKSAPRPVRVLLKQGPALLVSEASRLAAPGRRAIALRSLRPYRFEPDGTDRRASAHGAGPAQHVVRNPRRLS